LTSADTCPAIICCLTTTLHAHGVWPFLAFPGPECLNAASAQSQIGFFNSLMGCLSPIWEQTQAEFWTTKLDKCAPHHWAHGLCLQLFYLTHSLWVTCNQLVQEQLSLQQRTTMEVAIQNEFALGIIHLLPPDHFHIRPTSAFKGFSLEKVLHLPLSEQQLWLYSIQSAQARGSRLSMADLTSMQASFTRWLHPATNTISN